MIDFDNDLDLYIRKVKVISSKLRPKHTFCCYFFFFKRWNMHTSAQIIHIFYTQDYSVYFEGAFDDNQVLLYKY